MADVLFGEPQHLVVEPFNLEDAGGSCLSLSNWRIFFTFGDIPIACLRSRITGQLKPPEERSSSPSWPLAAVGWRRSPAACTRRRTSPALEDGVLLGLAAAAAFLTAASLSAAMAACARRFLNTLSGTTASLSVTPMDRGWTARGGGSSLSASRIAYACSDGVSCVVACLGATHRTVGRRGAPWCSLLARAGCSLATQRPAARQWRAGVPRPLADPFSRHSIPWSSTWANKRLASQF